MSLSPRSRGLFDTHQWSDADINLGGASLFGIALTDFEVMPIGSPVAFSNVTVCTLNHFGDDVIQADGFNW